MKPWPIRALGVVGPAGRDASSWLRDFTRRDLALLSPPTEATKESVWPGANPALRVGSTVSPEAIAALAEDGSPDIEAQVLWGFRAETRLGSKGLRTLDRLTRLTLCATADALEDAGLGDRETREAQAIGLSFGTAFGSLESIEELHRVVEQEEPRFVNPARFPNTVVNSTAGHTAIWHGLEGPNLTAVDGRVSFHSALAHATQQLSLGEVATMVVGAGETLSQGLCVALGDWVARQRALLGAMSRPRYCEGVCAFVLGEGTERPLAYWRATALRFEPPPPGRQLALASGALRDAIEAALDEAGVAQIDAVICAGGEGAHPALDRAELAGIEAAVGASCPVLAPSRLLGEGFSLGAAFGAAVALGVMRGGESGPVLRGQLSARPQHVLLSSLDPTGVAAATVLSREL